MTLVDFMDIEANVRSKIREIKDYPKKNINFKDITPLLQDNTAFSACINHIANIIEPEKINYVAGIESRGFLIASALAYRLNAGLIPIRKKGKLPYNTLSEEYKLEYGEGSVEIHTDALKNNDKVVVADDLLATGGTARAAVNLIKKLGGSVVALAFLIELTNLNGREKLRDYRVISIVKY